MKGISLFICTLLIGYSAYCQKGKNSSRSPIADTLFVSVNTTTYLVFPSEIELVDIGSKGFGFKVEKNILLLKCAGTTTPLTDMLVKFGGGNLFSCLLVYSAHPKKTLYDFRDKASLDNEKAELSDSSRIGRTKGAAHIKPVDTERASKQSLNPDRGGVYNIPADSIQKALTFTYQMPPHFRTFGRVKNSITFLLRNLCMDKKYMYLSFEIINKSNLNYSLDYVSVEYYKSSNSISSKMLDLVYSPESKTIAKSERQILVYVVPFFAVGKGGYFLVTFREADGNRKANLTIPYRAIRSATNLDIRRDR